MIQGCWTWDVTRGDLALKAESIVLTYIFPSFPLRTL